MTSTMSTSMILCQGNENTCWRPVTYVVVSCNPIGAVMSNDSLRTLKLNISANVKNRTVTSTIFRRVSVPLTEYVYAAISIDVTTARRSAFENCLRFSTQYSTHECFSCSRVDDFNTSRSSDTTTFMVLQFREPTRRLSSASP